MAGSVREVRLAEVFVALARSLEPDHDVIDTMDVLVQAATQFTSAADAGIVLADEDGTLHVLASTSERASDVEEEQLGVREGPCLESYRTGEPVDLPDLADTDRWPAFTHVALEQGFRSAHATPLRLGSRTLGALNVFSENYGSLSAGEIALLQAFTDVAALALVHSENLQQQNDLAAQLRHASTRACSSSKPRASSPSATASASTAPSPSSALTPARTAPVSTTSPTASSPPRPASDPRPVPADIGRPLVSRPSLRSRQ